MKMPTGEVIIGPLAVFNGNNGVSLTMTRSIGDRDGPSSSIPIPDMSAITIPSKQFARFILASDGLWDVMSIQEVEQEIWKFKDIHFLAEYLSNIALDKRIERKMRIDDITVIIIDINPAYGSKYFQISNCQCIIA